ncbi:MAG TPA: hypothetical protein VLW85_01950 [Myxococcales bacterium]|nr:hypothetical protein [Myxococcales bacterium]
MQVTNIPGKLEVLWCADVKAMLDRWSDHAVTIAEFHQASVVEGASFARRNGAIAWITDSRAARGRFSPEVHAFVAVEVFKALAAAGVLYFISIEPPGNAQPKSRYPAAAALHGLRVVKVPDVEAAFAFLKAQGPAI